MALTSAQIDILIDDLRDNRTGSITPAKLRGVLKALLEYSIAHSTFSTAVPYMAGIAAQSSNPQTIVVYAGALYACTTDHTTAAIFATENWELISPSLGEVFPTQLDLFVASLPTDPSSVPVGEWWNNDGIPTQVQ